MRKTGIGLTILVTLTVILVSLSVVPLAAAGPNSFNDSPGITIASSTPITIDGAWEIFDWSGTLPVFAVFGPPFTFDTPRIVTLDITDVLLKGDWFRIYDNGVAIGETPVVPSSMTSTTGDPDAALEDPTYSHRSFQLPYGSHSITIEALGGFESGSAYIRVRDTYIRGAGGEISAVNKSGLVMPWAALVLVAATGLYLFRRRVFSRK